MDKIILCFNLKNTQTDFSNFMQVVQAFEKKNQTDFWDYTGIMEKISIRYCWIKGSVQQRFWSLDIAQNIEKQWHKGTCEAKSIWEAHELTELGSMVEKSTEYQISYYVRIKNVSDEDIINIQYLLLVLQQFPSIRNRIVVFIEPFKDYIYPDKRKWEKVSVYHKYSHFMRFVLASYKYIFYSAFYMTESGEVNIQQLSSIKKGIQSTFFPLIEVDSDMYSAFNRYCTLDEEGMPIIEKEVVDANSRLKDLLEISKRMLDKRIKELPSPGRKKMIASDIYQSLSKKKITALEYAVFSVLVPVWEITEGNSIDKFLERARSISRGLIQIIENIFIHSYNHKGIFSLRIARETLKIDIADANIYETILDNFLKKLENRDKYFSGINLSVSHFFQKFHNETEKEAWKGYREENPVRCMGLLRLEQELRLCKAKLAMRSSTRYSINDEKLIYHENNYDSLKLNDVPMGDFIPGTQYQILFPVLYEETKQHNANIFMNGVGNFVEKDKDYAEFVKYSAECLIDCDITELDKQLYQSVLSEQNEGNEKDQMVHKWVKVINEYNAKMDPKDKKVYFLDMCRATNMYSPWGVETFCKGIVDSDILCGGQVRYFAIINCNSGFIKMMFDTIVMSNKLLNSGMQFYLHADNGVDDMVLSGNNMYEVVKNAQQYCYLKENPIAFVEEYEKNIDDGEFVSSNPQVLFPFDVILPQTMQRDMTLFEQYIGNVAQHPLMATDGAGYWLNNIHMRLGNKVHLEEFYEISILFRKPRIARKTALLMIRRMIKEGVALQNHFLLYGYASYSREILIALSEIIKECQQKEGDSDYFVEFAVYQNDIMVQKTLSHISAKVKMYFSREIPDGVKVKILQIVPIISTLTTFKKMWDMFLENYKEKVTAEQLIKNYTLFWVRDLQERAKGDEPTELEREYWEEISENRTIKTALIKPSPQFFCYKKIKWYNPLKCEQCYPPKVLDEFALVETDVTSTVPSQQLEVNVPSQSTGKDKRKQIINEIRLVNLKECIFYGHVYRDGNHFQYYIDTTQYFHKEKEYIAQWLYHLQQDTEGIREANALNIIVSPQHHTNVEFGHYVSNYFFNGNADVIVMDSTKEYRSNIITKYADVKAAISVAVRQKMMVRFTYVDDTIITGTTYRRVNNLLHSLVPKEIQKPIQFDHVFVLVNRMSLHSKMDFVEDVEKDFHAFVDINVSSVRNFGDSCAMCTLQKNAKLFFKRSSTKDISQYWDKKQYDYRAVAFDKYPQSEGCQEKNEQGYLRLLCSHYAKEHLAVSDDHKKSILDIIGLMSGIIRIGKKEIKEKAMPLEKKDIIDYFVSENLSPIYCCVFRQGELDAIKSYMKILCRPFFSYGKIYKQVILDVFLLISESFLSPEFDALLLNQDQDISSIKKYLNDLELRRETVYLCRYLKENILQPIDRMVFIQKYLMEGLTDLRSNYIIRKATMDKYKNLLPKEIGYYEKYYKYEKLIHRLINSSADETKSLWLEYLLVTGVENSTNLNDLEELKPCDMDMENEFGLFWKSLMIENTRLYYDSMLFFVQKASSLIEKRDIEPDEAIHDAVDELWGDYYIKNLRRFVCLEILAEMGRKTKYEIETEIHNRVIKTASLLYLLKKGSSVGIDRYADLKQRILDLLYKGDELKILTSAFAGAQNRDELYAVTDYKSKNVSPLIAGRVKEAVRDKNLENKSYYVGKDYIVLCINNNEEYLRTEKISDAKSVKIQPLYFYIECKTDNPFLVVYRIRKILMYRHQMLHWIEADFNNNAMPILAEQMGINRQLMRERAGDHNTNNDILTIEKLLQSDYKEQYGEIYHFLLLKVYVNMRIARLFRSEWSESRLEAYTLEVNDDKMNKAMKNIGSSIFDETLLNLSPKQYLAFMKDVFRFDVDVFGYSLNDADILDLEDILRKLNGRCENGYYYKQEYIICIIFDILFTAIKYCINWDIEIHKYFSQQKKENSDNIESVNYFFEDNEIIAQYLILKRGNDKCRITIKSQECENKNVSYLVLKNKVHNILKEELAQLNKELREKMEVKETAGMSLQAMKWYTESLDCERTIKADFFYEWNEEQQFVEFVIKLPILSNGGE